MKYTEKTVPMSVNRKPVTASVQRKTVGAGSLREADGMVLEMLGEAGGTRQATEEVRGGGFDRGEGSARLPRSQTAFTT